MATLIHDKEHIMKLEDFIDQAKVELVFFSPYFKLHNRLKDRLSLRRHEHKLRIVVVFGKNEDDPSRSLSREDFEFLKEFPYITIKYEKRLHAKYYANEKEGMITSLNLHTFSIENNYEVGVLFKNKGVLKKLTDSALGTITSIISDTEDIGTDAFEYFINIYKNAELVFENEPRYENKYFGLQKNYIGSRTLTDNSARFFAMPATEKAQRQPILINSVAHPQPVYSSVQTHERPATGFCIRTGSIIPFNPARPLSYEAFKSWSQYQNPDYQEKFCHACGKSSGTSVRYPLCTVCDNKLYPY